jgi:hypothetical protein
LRPKKRASLIDEIKRRQALDPDRVLDIAFPEQRSFITSTDPFNVACTPRGTAKTYAHAIRQVWKCLKTPHTQTGYAGLTFANVQRDFYEQSVKSIIRKLDLPVETPASLPLKFPNGSIMYGWGLDNAEKAMEKIRGFAGDDFAMDEVQSFRADPKKLIMTNVFPAVARRGGQIFLTLTPGEVMDVWAHRVSDGREPGWKQHFWSWEANIHVADNNRAMLDFLTQQDPNFVRSSAYLREWKGIWVPDNRKLVYNYHPQNLDVDELPTHVNDWVWVLCVDLGHSPDPTAFVVFCYSYTHPCIYVVEFIEELRLDPIDVKDVVLSLEEKYGFTHRVVDGASGGKALAAMLTDKWGLSFHPALGEKRGKKDHIEFVNADLRAGNIKLLPAVQEAFKEEWSHLVWDQKFYAENRKWREHPDAPNHKSDAFLYGYMYSRHFNADQGSMGPEPSPVLLWQKQVKEEQEQYAKRLAERYVRRSQINRSISSSDTPHFEEDPDAEDMYEQIDRMLSLGEFQ